MSPLIIGILGIISFFVLIMLNIPIAYVMLLVGFIGFSLIVSPAAAFSMITTEIFANFSSYSLSVIPMFVWMGFIAYYSNVGSDLYKFTYRLIGHRPGGLAIATQAACGLFGAICGSNTATAATMGAIALPEMRKYKYNDSLSTASVAAGGALGVLIPPSVIFIVYGVAAEQSIGALFVSGIVPGILLMLLYMLTIYIIVKRRPDYAPIGEKFTWKERLTALRGGLWEIIITFCISLGGLFAGWFTPTEAGAIGAGSIFFITVFERRLGWEGLKKSLTDATKTTAMIMLLVAVAMVFGRFIAVSRLPFEIASFVTSLTLPPIVVMIMILIVYFILGCFIDALALILLTIPIFFPVVTGVLGYDPIWFGVIVVLVVAMGVISPPVGMNVFIVKGVAGDFPIEVIYKGVWPFLVAIAACVAILIAFPQIATFLV